MEKEKGSLPKKSVFETLNAIDCSKYIDKKGNLSYLSWAWAWSIVKKNYPSASWTKKRWNDVPYLLDPKLGYLVETSVTIDGETIEMQLPVMDSNNKAQKDVESYYKVKEYVNGKPSGKYIDKPIEAATMFDINTAIMRCLVKNLSMFGLGLYIYAGEDLPMIIEDTNSPTQEKPKTQTPIVQPPKEQETKPIPDWIEIEQKKFVELGTINMPIEPAKKKGVVVDGSYILQIGTTKNEKGEFIKGCYISLPTERVKDYVKRFATEIAANGVVIDEMFK